MTKAIGLAEIGVIIATREKRIADWIGEYIKAAMSVRHALRYAETVDEFGALARLPRMATAFIEVDFFGEKIIAQLSSLRKSRPGLQVVLFTASYVRPGDSGRYMWWGGDSFVCLRDDPGLIRKQIEIIMKGLNSVTADVLDGIRDYQRPSMGPPHFTPREIEIIRCTARGKTVMGTAAVLGIGGDTVRNYRAMLYRKCGVKNAVGLVKAGFTAGVLLSGDLHIQFRPKEWEE
jgi:DNA-binding CsgD family transcriptional regulator